MAPAGDERLDRLDAPAKAALRWAWAMAITRTGSGDSEVDWTDLLAGILLADPRGSPARELLDHYGIPVGAMLRRDRGRPPSAEDLLEAIQQVPTDRAPPIADAVRLYESGIYKVDRLVSLRDLFWVMLADSRASGALFRELANRGVDEHEVVKSYEEFMRGNTTYGELLRERYPYRPRQVELPDYLADQPRTRGTSLDGLSDLVGIDGEVDAFAYLIASTRLVPPLAVGLFGDWGSGKSYFLRCLQRRIDRVARDAEANPPPKGSRPLFHPHIVQIEFNAWQYVGGDLWASLLEHLFRNLRRTGDDSDRLLEQRQNYWVHRVQGATTERDAAELKRKELEAKRDTARRQVKDLQLGRERALAKLEREQRERPLAGWRPSDELRRRIREATVASGITAVGERAEELTTELARAQDALRGLGSVLAPVRARGWRYQLVLWALIILPIAITFALKALNLGSLTAVTTTVASGLAALAGYVKLGTKVVADTTARIRQAEADLAEERTKLDSNVIEAERNLDKAQSELDAAVVAERKLAAAADEVAAELAATTPRRVLSEFIADRLASEDYRQHLGVPAIVRRDLERLSQLVAQQRENPDGDPVPDEYAIDRIVLYIDDLDRCPTELVIKVLEAVHLLLAFPLFVVVVAVDSRWLTRSLTEHYAAQFRGEGATPANYLEKIFQVPFQVLPVDSGVRQQILRGLLLPNLTNRQPATATKAAAVSDSVLQADEIPEFRELVSSFAGTGRHDQAWRAATGLTITPDELATIESVADLIGDTPRAAKRFVNIYLLVKSMGVNRGLTFPPDGQLALLLAIGTGLPTLADELFPRLMQPDPEAFAGIVATPHPQSHQLINWLDAHPDFKRSDMSGVADWVRLIARFRFASGDGVITTGPRVP